MSELKIQDEPACCFSSYCLRDPTPSLDENEPEVKALPQALHGIRIVNGHAHVAPPKLTTAIQRWFERNGWKSRYTNPDPFHTVQFHLDCGIEHMALLQYSHRPGMSRGLNEWMAEFITHFGHDKVTGFATVFPGESDVERILEEALKSGLTHVKLHSHVQKFAADDWEKMDVIYSTCSRLEMPILAHFGREPATSAYGIDTHGVCGWRRVEAVLKKYPRLKLCVPHLGMNELDGYEWLLRHHSGLYLDTTMTLGRYFNVGKSRRELAAWVSSAVRDTGRVMWGSDWPNHPYRWDRELQEVGHWIEQGWLSRVEARDLLSGASDRFLNRTPPPRVQCKL